MSILYLVVPCYDEEAVLIETSSRLLAKVDELIKGEKISKASGILFVDDGSKDATWRIIQELHLKKPEIRGLKLSRNCGHQNALLAGLMTAKDYADIVISLDADLQDDIQVIDNFIDEFKKGNEIVYGVRSARETDTFFKKNSALWFYRVLKALGVEIVENHADYRLMSKVALDALSDYREVNLFLRGMIPLIGYRSSVVSYERAERFAGESKYPLKKMIAFALDGITSFSIKPIRIITWIGFTIFLISLITLGYSLIVKLKGYTVSGWTSIVSSIWLIGGIQLLSLGVIGEYVGKIYKEVKDRPKYRIEKFLN